MEARDIIAWADHRAEGIVRGPYKGAALLDEIRRACCIAYKLGVEDATAVVMRLRDYAQDANTVVHAKPNPTGPWAL